MKIHRIAAPEITPDFDAANYALNRGETLAVEFDDGSFVFCFMPLR